MWQVMWLEDRISGPDDLLVNVIMSLWIQRKGGLALIWNDPFDITICSYSVGHIDCIITHDHRVWRFTGFYGNPIPHLIQQSWDLLHRLAQMREFQHLPWLVGGDFNEILYEEEKIGGSMRSLSQMSAFREALNSCNLRDIHCLGDQFTWCNRRQQQDIIFERLDRFVCSSEWQLIYPSADVHNLDFYGSDHRLIMISNNPHLDGRFSKGPRRFTFEHKWMLEEDFPLLLEHWNNGGLPGDLPAKLSTFSGILNSWADTRFSHMARKISNLHKELSYLQHSRLAKDNYSRIASLEKEIEKLVVQEEIHWKQRARSNWL
ncbi:uncharacterized protein [Henckelia pumila]|uniref:uncharacterized protein n=1 Tax=Henckelia pumila TaxID=405737 RepID=UPI003C6DFA76